MKITFAGVELTNLTDAFASSVSVNGEFGFEAVDIVQRFAKKLFPRGNQFVSVSFAVAREFDTRRECEVYLLTHFTLLPKSGLCTITCGGAGEDEQDVLLANAILTASPAGGYNGVSATVVYTIVAGSAETDVPPGFLVGEVDDVSLRGKEAIANGAESVAIVFDVPFTDPPIVTCSVTKPASGANIWATIREDSVTADGFTADLSGPAPAAGYKLTWFAISA